MYSSRKVKCADCGDVFIIEYDSRKERQDVYTCKCGKLRCRPDSFGGFSYYRGGNYKEIDYKDEEHTILKYEEDYIKLSDAANTLLSEIDNLGKQLHKKISVYYFNHSNNERISLELGGGSEKEGITIKTNVSLYDKEGWKYDKEKQESRVVEALTRFRGVIVKVNNGELDLSKPKKIWEDESLEWYDGTKTQQKIYDYELFC